MFPFCDNSPCILTIFLPLALACAAHASSKNGVLGEPALECDTRRMLLTLRTQKPFRGKIYVRGNSHKRECLADYSTAPGAHSALIDHGNTIVDQSQSQNFTIIRTTIDHDSCHTEKIKTLSPNGIAFENTVIVQFHRHMVTLGDKSFNVRCFYAESETTVESKFEVSMIPTGLIQHDMQMPNCLYSVRGQTLNGPLIKSAEVGATVFHKWECKGGSDFYGMLVHSCFAESLDGQKTPITDDKGCSLDEDLLPNLSYGNDLKLAYAKANVFKYPDHSYIQFRCQIRLCPTSEECLKIMIIVSTTSNRHSGIAAKGFIQTKLTNDVEYEFKTFHYIWKHHRPNFMNHEKNYSIDYTHLFYESPGCEQLVLCK